MKAHTNLSKFTNKNCASIVSLALQENLFAIKTHSQSSTPALAASEEANQDILFKNFDNNTTRLQDTLILITITTIKQP